MGFVDALPLKGLPVFYETNTHNRTTFFTLKFSSGVTSGSWPLSFWRTICCTMRSRSNQYWTVFPLLLSERNRDHRTIRSVNREKEKHKEEKRCFTAGYSEAKALGRRPLQGCRQPSAPDPWLGTGLTAVFLAGPHKPPRYHIYPSLIPFREN